MLTQKHAIGRVNQIAQLPYFRISSAQFKLQMLSIARGNKRVKTQTPPRIRRSELLRC